MGATLSDPVRIAKQNAYLESLAKSGIVRIACEVARIHRSTPEYWREHDSDYARREKDAKEDSADVCEAELLRRGMVGMRQFQFWSGKPIYWHGKDGNGPKEHYYEDKRSDACLIMTLKARRPEKFRERHEVTGAGGGPLSVVHANIGLARMVQQQPDLAARLDDLIDAADAERDEDGSTRPATTVNGEKDA